MHLIRILHFGYGVIVGTFLLMIWISLSGARQIQLEKYPPCYFNSLCSCSKSMPDLGMIICLDVHLPRIPEPVNVSKAFKLHLINNGLRTIEPYFLQSTGLYEIEISYNPMTLIPDEAFLGLERSLWVLKLTYNQLTRVPYRAMKYLQKLKVLDLTGNDINKISPENWRGLGHSLEELILADNSISHLPIDSFGGLPSLETIDLRGNNLRDIDPSVFRDGMGKLAYLLLSDNQLSSIPYQAVAPLRMLKILDLSHNRISKMHPTGDGVPNFQINLDELLLNYNQISLLEPISFQLFNVLNKTYMNGNPIMEIEDNAFRQAKIRELYLRDCQLAHISPVAFEGLENYLEILDLSGNNIVSLENPSLMKLGLLGKLKLGDNQLRKINIPEWFNMFQYTLHTLDLSGIENSPVALQDLRRLRNLRSLSLSRLSQNVLSPEDFKEFGTDLEEVSITSAGLQTIQNNAFKHVHGIKRLDLSENSISTFEVKAFEDIGHSLIKLNLAHALSSSMQTLPNEVFQVLISLRDLDVSNNKIRTLPSNSFHFLNKLRRLEMQDNLVEVIQKGTFQGDIHSNLEDVYFSFNSIKTVRQHTFVDLSALKQLHLDDNRIDTIDRRSFMNLEKLKRLNLKGNEISSISYEAFQNIPDLEHLDLSYNRIGSFDFSIFDQVGTLSMFHVNISHNKLFNLAVNLASLDTEFGAGVHTNVKILDLSHNNITAIGKQFFKPAELSLTRLYLGHNRILNASKDVFGNMPHLQLLDLSVNMIYELEFDTFRNTKNLQVLDVSGNRLTEIPNDLFRLLKHLRSVNFSTNRLRALPDNLFRDEGLESLNLSHNLLGKLPLNCLSIAAASTLHELDLSWNSISSLAHGGVLARFKNLNYLDLSYNRLAQIDAGTFKDVPKLLSLDLSHNSQLTLEPFGQSFRGLEYSLLELNLDNVSLAQVPTLPTPHLYSLSLNYNYLPTVPPEMATNLTSLCKLNLNYNDLTAVPIVTHSLPQLRYLSMAGNPFTTLSNTSLLGVADRLKELDISSLDLFTFETGALCKMFALRTLKVDVLNNVPNFNIPRILQNNFGLRNLVLNADVTSDKSFDKELAGFLPPKVKNVTFSGRGFKTISASLLQGIQHPTLQINLKNTSIANFPINFFKNIGQVKNISLDIRNNREFQKLPNPSTGGKPNLRDRIFLIDLKMSGNRWTCDCDLGWVEVWQRKRRQYICGDAPSTSASLDYFDYTCRHADDDLRTSLCSNKNNQSLVDVLKTDIECGWSCSVKISSFTYGCTAFFVIGVQIFS